MSLTAWRPALRMARRDLVRNKGRNALVAVMVGLPVLAVSTFATVYETNAISPVEGLDQQLGQTQALVNPAQREPIDQEPDGNWQPARGSTSGSPDSKDETAAVADKAAEDTDWTPQQVRGAVGADLIDITSGSSSAVTARGRTHVRIVGVDGADKALTGLVDLRSGRLPRNDSEVLVSPWLAGHGFPIGHNLEVTQGVQGSGAASSTGRVVGVAVMPSVFDNALVVARPSSPVAALAAGEQTQHTYLVPGPKPVTWQRVRELNQLGLAITSRSVIQNPPANWEDTLSDPGAFASFNGSDAATRAVLFLVVFSIVLEVILLAGPAFAVGVRRSRRQLALVAATGGTARDVRRVVLAQALTTGALAAVLGAALGIPLAALIVALIPHFLPETVLGPFDVAWVALLVATALGAVAALTAAYFPARAAARQNVVAVLAGRRGQVGSRPGLPVLGGVLLGVGAAVALVRGTRQGGELWVAAGTLTMVLGAIALMPALVGGVGRLGRRLPLPLRLATRDSARQRSRTAPAVAAVMAAVAGVTALAIGASSDFAQSRRDYQPRLPAGVTTVQASDMDAAWWDAADATTQALAPGRALLATGTLGGSTSDPMSTPDVYVAPPGCPTTPPVSETADEKCVSWMTAGLKRPTAGYSAQSSLVANQTGLEALGYQLDDEQRAVLARGGVLVPSAALVDDSGHARLVTFVSDYSGSKPKVAELQTRRVLAAPIDPLLTSGGMPNLTGAILTPKAAETLKLPWAQNGAVLSPSAIALSRDAQDKLQETLLGSAQYADVYTERGFDESFALPLVGLVIIAALAVLVGTLTATGLALVDGRPDAATLAAIGARPRTRRTMASAQAVVIGLLGSLAGIAVGLVPGIAVAWPLTAQHNGPDGMSVWGSPIIRIPWLMLALIGIGVPLLAAAAAGLGVRSRLPLTRRLGQ